MAAHEGRVSGPNVLPVDPDPSDYGMVVRPIPGIPEPALSTWRSDQVAVGVIAVLVVTVPLAERRCISLRASCAGGAEIFLGPDATVTTATGTGLKDRETISMDLKPTAEVWAIASAPAQKLYVAEVAA